MAGTIRIVGRTSPDRRCGYCHGGGGQLTSCDACDALTHVDCRAELGRCTTIGCVGAARAASRIPASLDVREAARALYWAGAVHLAAVVGSWVGAALLWQRALFPAAPVRGPRADDWGMTAVVGLVILTLMAVGCLWVSVPWLAGLPGRAARLRRLSRWPRPCPARLGRRATRQGPEGALQQFLTVTTRDGARAEFLVGGLALPPWGPLPADQEITVYGDVGDPTLVELADGRLMLLFRD